MHWNLSPDRTHFKVQVLSSLWHPHPHPTPSKSDAKFYDSLHVKFPLSTSSFQIWLPIFESQQEKPRQYLRHYSVNCARARPTPGLSKTPSAQQKASAMGQLPQEVGQDAWVPHPPTKSLGWERQPGWARSRWPGLKPLTQSGLRTCAQDQGWKEPTTEWGKRKTFTAAPRRGKTGKENWAPGPGVVRWG